MPKAMSPQFVLWILIEFHDDKETNAWIIENTLKACSWNTFFV